MDQGDVGQFAGESKKAIHVRRGLLDKDRLAEACPNMGMHAFDELARGPTRMYPVHSHVIGDAIMIACLHERVPTHIAPDPTPAVHNSSRIMANALKIE
jgi:hypothetical protein